MNIIEQFASIFPKDWFYITYVPTYLTYNFFPSHFGLCLIAGIPEGLCYFSFVDEGEDEALERLNKVWNQSQLIEAPIDNFSGQCLALKGTDFQIQVWKALALIPKGKRVTYQDMAKSIGRPLAVRAVANAIAVNPLAYILPCHRVMGKSGSLCGYRWGLERKQRLLEWEGSL